MKYDKKVYLYAFPHPTAGIVLNDGTKNGMRGYWAGGNKEKGEVKFIIRELVKLHGVQEGKRIYKAFNEALINVRASKYFSQGDTACMVLYLPSGDDDSNV